MPKYKLCTDEAYMCRFHRFLHGQASPIELKLRAMGELVMSEDTYFAEISRRAYLLWVNAGYPEDGRDEQRWLDAERQYWDWYGLYD